MSHAVGQHAAQEAVDHDGDGGERQQADVDSLAPGPRPADPVLLRPPAEEAQRGDRSAEPSVVPKSPSAQALQT